MAPTENLKMFGVRLPAKLIHVIELISNFRGGTRAEVLLEAFKLLAYKTFAKELKELSNEGKDFPLQRLPQEVRLSDLFRMLNELEEEFKERRED